MRYRVPHATGPDGGGNTIGPITGHAVPIRSCSRWGLPCRLRRRRRGALLPHPFTLAGAFAPAVCFLRHYPWSRLRRALPGTVFPWSPDFPPPGNPRSSHPAVWPRDSMGSGGPGQGPPMQRARRWLRDRGRANFASGTSGRPLESAPASQNRRNRPQCQVGTAAGKQPRQPRFGNRKRHWFRCHTRSP